MRASKLESDFQADLIHELKDLFPGCMVLKNDSAYLQGVPDLIVLYQTHWAMLEVKASPNSRKQPNQDYYVDMLDDMSFAAFIYPENKKVVLDELQHAFRARRSARVSQR